jgi:hypothetical protein
MSKIKRYVKVVNETTNYAENSVVRTWQVKDTDFKIYDTKNNQFYKLENKLYIVKNLNGENVYECLGTIIDEYDKMDGLI